MERQFHHKQPLKYINLKFIRRILRKKNTNNGQKKRFLSLWNDYLKRNCLKSFTFGKRLKQRSLPELTGV